MVTGRSSRKYYVVGEGATLRPRFDAALSLHDNVVTIAEWEWGGYRATWVAEVADQLGAEPEGDRAEWTAAVLCAAAVDAGRDRKPGWSRTLTALTEMTGVPRDAMLARFAQLSAIRAA